MAAPTCATDSFSQNWLLNTYAAFEFSYIRNDLEAEECDDQGLVGLGSFNFGTKLPHWFQVDDADDSVVYADELFSDGYIKAPEFNPILGEVSRSEREALGVVKYPESSVSSPAPVLRCRFLGIWGKHAERVMIRCWKVFKCGLKLKKKHESQSAWSSGGSGPGGSYVNMSVENPIYEAVLHCKRSFEA